MKFPKNITTIIGLSALSILSSYYLTELAISKNLISSSKEVVFIIVFLCVSSMIILFMSILSSQKDTSRNRITSKGNKNIFIQENKEEGLQNEVDNEGSENDYLQS